MAHTTAHVADPITHTFTSTEVLNVGNGDEAVVSCWIVQVSGTFTGTGLKFRKKIHKSAVADASAPLTWYEASDVGTTPVAAGTVAAASSQSKIYTDGCDLILDVTLSTGSMIVELVPLRG